jgi:hypothetical protein
MQASRAGRYLTEPTLFWCALIMLTISLMGHAFRPSASWAFLLILGILSAMILKRSSQYFAWWDNYFQRGQWASIAFANGLEQRSVDEVIFPSSEYIAKYRHVLTDNRLAVFADPEPYWIGRPATQIFSRGYDGLIHGEITTIKKIGSDYEIQGWTDGTTRVVFEDESGRIIGFGMRPNDGPPDLYTHDVPASLAFTGFIRGDLAAHNFSFWAIDRKGRQAYRTGRLQYQLPQ